jgi:hypothetical protein
MRGCGISATRRRVPRKVDILPNSQVTVQVDFEEAHATSVGLLDFLEENHTKVGLAVIAMVLSVGRLMAIEEVTEESEAKFTQDCLDWLGAYFSKGLAN